MSAAVSAPTPNDQDATAEQLQLATNINRLRIQRDALLRRAVATARQSKTGSAPATPDPATQRTREVENRKVASTAPASSASDAETFAELSGRLGGQIGLAYAPVGVGRPATQLGNLTTGVGWSTMKVPVAIATIQQANGRPDDETMRLMRLAITHSDNDAAMALWSKLGTPILAADKTRAILRAGGDAHTQVPSTAPRPGYTPFGQSIWSLADQATFAASLPCTANTSPVLALMAQVTSSQRWGIGTISSTQAFKGGWGPGADGAYLVRQMAVVRLSDGSAIGLSLAAQAADGRFETGVHDLNMIAGWATKTIRSGGGIRC